MLYRLLRPDEKWKDGLTAKDPNSDVSVFNHVINGSGDGNKSKYISTCRNLATVNTFKSNSTNPGQIVKILEDDLPVNIIDLTTQENRKKYYSSNPSDNERFNNFAKCFQEVLLVGNVPASHISLVT